MPFPLAHPAAILPLRRCCPRWLSFPALVLGTLCPDLGYLFSRQRWDELSHRPLAGTLAFCLPAGLALVGLFYGLRRPVVGCLPARPRQALLPLCQQPVPSLLPIVASVLVGALTHQLLDAATHPQFWLVRHWPGLLRLVPLPGGHYLMVSQLLYAACTFFGVAWLARVYLRWWDRAVGGGQPPAFQWLCILILASGMLWIAQEARSPRHGPGLRCLGVCFFALTSAFLLLASWPFGPAPRANASGVGDTKPPAGGGI